MDKLIGIHFWWFDNEFTSTIIDDIKRNESLNIMPTSLFKDVMKKGFGMYMDVYFTSKKIPLGTGQFVFNDHLAISSCSSRQLLAYPDKNNYIIFIEGDFKEDKYHLNPNCLFYNDPPRYKEIVKQIFNGICELTRKDIITPFLNDR